MIDRNKRILIRESPFFAIPIFREAPFKADRLAFEGAPFLLKYSLAGLYEGVLSNSFPHLRLRTDQLFIGSGRCQATIFADRAGLDRKVSFERAALSEQQNPQAK